MPEQRTDEWHNIRRGRFTASEIHKLLGVKGLGATGESYCFEKAVEIVFGIDEDERFESWDMRRGINLEPVAFEQFSVNKMYDFIDVEKAYFFPLGEDAGASPDGLTSDNGVLEIKCPRSVKFFDIVANGIKSVDSAYLSQMQMQILCSKSSHAYFFNYIIFKGVPMWHEIVLERDEERIGLIQERLPQAIKLRNEFVEYLTNNKQF